MLATKGSYSSFTMDSDIKSFTTFGPPVVRDFTYITCTNLEKSTLVPHFTLNDSIFSHGF